MTDEPSPAPIRVAIIDDHEMFAESLHRLLGDDPRIDVISVDSTAGQGIESARTLRPDVVIMDLVLPDLDGAEATKLLMAERPAPRVVILTGSERAGGYFAAREAGCAAWVRKTRAVHDLVAVVHAVFDGQLVVDDGDLELPDIDDLLVYYQPILDLPSRSIVGFEALVRWNHPTLGVLSPAAFLPLAEETGFIGQIGTFVGAQALRDLRSWHDRFDPELFVCVNLSPSGLNSPHIAADVRSLLDASSVDPQRLVLEITETAILEDTPVVAANLDALKATGVRLALDDFGTAFSSLSLVRRFPFDHLKIDQSFVAELPHTPRAVLLMEAVHHLAESLGMNAIAEGIERTDQLDCLLATSWTLGQGYLFSRPVPEREIAAMLE